MVVEEVRVTYLIRSSGRVEHTQERPCCLSEGEELYDISPLLGLPTIRVHVGDR